MPQPSKLLGYSEQIGENIYEPGLTVIPSSVDGEFELIAKHAGATFRFFTDAVGLARLKDAAEQALQDAEFCDHGVATWHDCEKCDREYEIDREYL